MINVLTTGKRDHVRGPYGIFMTTLFVVVVMILY